jgi:hypothetical protein
MVVPRCLVMHLDFFKSSGEKGQTIAPILWG